MSKARNCDCHYDNGGIKTLCLYHWEWARLIDEARTAMASDASWTKRANEVPSVKLFPLEQDARRGRDGVPRTPPHE